MNHWVGRNCRGNADFLAFVQPVLPGESEEKNPRRLVYIGWEENRVCLRIGGEWGLFAALLAFVKPFFDPRRIDFSYRFE